MQIDYLFSVHRSDFRAKSYDNINADEVGKSEFNFARLTDAMFSKIGAKDSREFMSPVEIKQDIISKPENNYF